MINGSIKINDISISFNDSENGKYAIIFIHGFPFDKSSWNLQYEALKAKFRVITYDIRGFGHSTSNSAPFSIDLFADDLIAFMDGLSIQKATICGLSMGGYIALNAINRYPDRIEKLILCDTQCIADSPEGKDKRYKTIDLLNNGGLLQWADAFTKNLFTGESLQNNQIVVSSIKEVMLSTSIQTLVSTLKALAERNETCSILTSIRVPVLILCGDSDVITPPDKSQQINQSIISSEMKIISRAGHLSNIEQAEIFNTYLMEFLSK